MAKKKKSHKKHQQFKYATPTAPSVGGEPKRSEAATNKPAASRSYSYEVASLPLIKKDLRKVIILAGSFVVLQLILWFLFDHTGLGPSIYRVIKV